MHKPKFYHEVLTPTIALLTRAAENVCVAADFSDVLSLAKQAAAAVYHFREPILRVAGVDRLGPMNDPVAEHLRQRLSDVADSSKHGVLRDQNRSTTLEAELAFEFNNKGQFRYLRTEVVARNGRWGEFEVADTIADFLPHLARELGVNLQLNIQLPQHPFLEWAETYVTTKSGFDVRETNLRMYRRNAADDLVLADPVECRFRVVQG